MSKSNISYPYPILDTSDDIEGEFIINAVVSSNNESLIINLENYLITNEYFNNLLQNKYLKLVVKAYCSSTMFSKTFENIKVIEIDFNTIATSLNLEFLLIANRDIENYYDNTFNSDYLDILNGNGFLVKKGSILGNGGEMKIPLTNIFTQGLKGIIQFEARNEIYPISFDLDGNKIVIYYPKKENEIDLIGYLGGKGSIHLNTFYSLIIIPAISAAYDEIINKVNTNDNLEEFIDNHTWALVITELFPEYSVCESGYIAAQLLLQILNKDESNQLPILKSFDELKDNI
jgi:hypothetical protein